MLDKNKSQVLVSKKITIEFMKKFLALVLMAFLLSGCIFKSEVEEEVIIGDEVEQEDIQQESDTNKYVKPTNPPLAEIKNLVPAAKPQIIISKYLDRISDDYSSREVEYTRYILQSVDPETLSLTDVAVLETAWYKPPFSIHNENVYYLTPFKEIGIYNLDTKEISTIAQPEEGIFQKEYEKQNHSFDDVEATDSEMLYLYGACYESELCYVGKYDFETKQHTKLSNEAIRAPKFGSMDIKNYDKINNKLEIRMGDGDGLYGYLSNYEFNLNNNQIYKIKEAKYNSACDYEDLTDDCKPGDIEENKRYEQLKEEVHYCGQASIYVEKDQLGIATQKLANEYINSTYVGCLEN